MIVGYGGEPGGFQMAQSGSLITTFPQASLRSRKVGFPESGSDLGATPRPPSQNECGLSADSNSPQLIPVYFKGRSFVQLPYIRLLLKPPNAQSPFARSTRLVVSDRVQARPACRDGIVPVA